jgi:putative endonuclease
MISRTYDSIIQQRKVKTEAGTILNFTYIVRCSDGTYYAGWTNDLDRRIAAHNGGTGGKYTRARRPVELVYSEEFETKREAQSREFAVKRLSRQEKERLIRGFSH